MRAPVIVLVDSGTTYEVYPGTPACAASIEWARFHGLEPNRIPAGSEIVRDAANCRILYEEFVFDGDPTDYANLRVENNEGVTHDLVEQGEAPPLPFPPEVVG